jgi:hypothetical protein
LQGNACKSGLSIMIIDADHSIQAVDVEIKISKAGSDLDPG